MNEYFLAFVPIFVAVDALGMLPIFMSLTAGMDASKKRELIRNSTLTALLVAVLFLWLGKQVFWWLGSTVNFCIIGGGAFRFILSFRALLSFGKGPNIPLGETMGVVPLAVPVMVGPAVLTTSLILQDSFGSVPTLISLFLNLVLCGVILRFSDFLSRILGKAGSHTLSKIFSLLLGAIGVMLMRRGLLDTLSSWLSQR